MSRPRILAALAATATLLLAACAHDTAATNESSAAVSDGTFPITIDHAFGSTTIDEKPERVATVAWANHEVPLALGVVPVGMAKVTWGDDDNDGVLPWVEEKLDELGAETPVLFDETDGIDYEAVAATEPDVILASYSGLTQEQYDTLSKIAPVVAYPNVPWATSYEDMIRINSTAIGKAAEGEALVDSLHELISSTLDNYPALKESAPIFAFFDTTDLSQIGFYTNHDTRPGFLYGLGLTQPSIVATESSKTDAFYTQISSEQADAFADASLIVTYGDTNGELLAQLQADPLLSKIPAIAQGHVAILENATPLANMGNPTPLNIPWGIDKYFAVLNEAL